jgi:glycosyltransferase involved in cell wall biosynthesis
MANEDPSPSSRSADAFSAEGYRPRSGKRVGVVLPNLFAIGAQRYVLGICKMLEARGFECDFLLQDPSGQFLREVPAAKVVPFAHRFLSRIRYVRTVESMSRLAATLRRGNYDIIFSVTPFLNRVLCALKAAGAFSSRLVIEEHGYPPLYLTVEDGMSKAEVMFYRNTFGLYRKADAIRVISDGIREFYTSVGLETNVILFPNLIDLPRIDRLGREDPTTRLSDRTRNVVYFGRLGLQKNVAFLIESIGHLRRTVDAHLWIIGDGDQRQSLEQTAQRLGLAAHITFLGYQENPYPLLKQGDVFALTSVWEGSPQVIVEAMTLGVPVVSVDCLTGPSEMLGKKSERGWLVPRAADPAGFAASLADALERKEETHRRAEAAKKFATNTYDLQTRIDEYIDVFFQGVPS